MIVISIRYIGIKPTIMNTKVDSNGLIFEKKINRIIQIHLK